MMVQNVRYRPAPSIVAAWSMSTGMVRMNPTNRKMLTGSVEATSCATRPVTEFARPISRST